MEVSAGSVYFILSDNLAFQTEVCKIQTKEYNEGTEITQSGCLIGYDELHK